MNERGRRIGLELNHEIIHTEPDGTKWSEVMVIRYIFALADCGTPVSKIAAILNEKGIPPPYKAKKMRNKTMKGESIWLAGTVSRKLRLSAYWGKAVMFKTRALPRVPGKRYAPRAKTTKDEQIVVPVPAIVTEEQALRVHKRLA